MRKFGLWVTLVLMLPMAAQAQTVEVGKAYKVAFDWSQGAGAAATGFRLYVCPGSPTDCGTKVGADIPLSVLAAGSVTVDATALTSRGAYVVQVGAFNQDKEMKSEAVPFSALLPAPPAPSAPRIVIVASQDSAGHTVWDWRIVDDAIADQLLARR